MAIHPKHFIFGLSGRAGSGKTTAAAHICRRYGAVEASFAAPLKKMAGAIWELELDQLYGSQAQKERIDPRWNMSARNMMQRLGEAARQHIGPNVWIDGCLNGIFELQQAHSFADPNDETVGGRLQRCVISDVRYLNEVARLKELGVRVVRLVRSDAPPCSNPNHPSEAEIDQMVDGDVFTISHSAAEGLDSLLKPLDQYLQMTVGWSPT